MTYCIHCKKLIKGTPNDQNIINFYKDQKNFHKLIPGFSIICQDCLYKLSEDELALAIIGLRDYFLKMIKSIPHGCSTCGCKDGWHRGRCPYSYSCRHAISYATTDRWTISWVRIANEIHEVPIGLQNDSVMSEVFEKIIPLDEWTIHNKQEIIKAVHKYYPEYKEVADNKWDISD